MFVLELFNIQENFSFLSFGPKIQKVFQHIPSIKNMNYHLLNICNRYYVYDVVLIYESC